MKRIKNENGHYVPSLFETVLFLSTCDTPLGDLCKDMIDDNTYIHFDNIDETWWYLNTLIEKHGKHLDEPVRRLKTIYSTIYRS